MSGLIAFALKQRGLVVLGFLILLIAGSAAFLQLNIEAYPDPVPPMVDVITQAPGQSAEEMERYVTIPIEVQAAGLPYLTSIRTISLFGLSDVKLQFTYDLTYEQAEQKVLNRLSQLAPLPNGAQPTISPTSPIGEIYRYRLVGPPGISLTDLKTLQDWVLQRRFRAVPGVIDVTGWGGKTKAIAITVDLRQLNANGLTLQQMLQALSNSNVNVGGNTVNIGPQSATVRGLGLIKSVEDVESTMIGQAGGVPVLVRDVAEVSVGNQPRLGIAGQDKNDDIVEGVVLMRRGQESLPTIKRVEAEVEKINSGSFLPPGVRIERIYDRAELISVTTHTVLHNMVFGMVLIFIVQWLFLGNLRSAVIVAATIPFALFFAVGVMVLRGESANLLSVGAIDFGLIVDATVIMVEAVFFHLAHDEAPLRGPATAGMSDKQATIHQAATEVAKAIFFSATIIIAGFVPLFTMAGVEGHIFGPMAKTYAYALAGGLIATFTVSPALSALLLPDRVSEQETLLVRGLRRVYRPALRLVLRFRIATLIVAATLFAGAVLGATKLGLEFLPHLEEGNLWIRATMPGSISLEQGNGYVNEMRKLLAGFPEIRTIVSQHGRPDDGTDATGFFNAEFFAPLKPAEEWPGKISKEELTEQMTKALEERFPGVEFNFSQYIQDNVEEAVSGVKGENSIKLIGPDLKLLQETAFKIKAILKDVPGVTDLAAYNALGQPSILIDIDRAKAARYGLALGDINATVQAAIGGQSAGDLYEQGSDRHFPLVVRLAPQYRESMDVIRNITIGAPSDKGMVQVPLSELASIKLISGASFIYREGQERYLPIRFSVRGRDLGSTVLDAQARVREQLKLPAGYRMEWVGEFDNLTSALNRLAIVVPLALFLIGLLLYLNFGVLKDTLLAASVIPMAMIGGILSLAITQTPFSISAAIGFIALFGISVMDGLIVMASYRKRLAVGVDRTRAVLRTCESQMRPVVMTCVAACAGLLPAAFSTGIGSQVQRPLALVVVGGITLAPVLILLVLPVLMHLTTRVHRPAPRAVEMALPQAAE